MDAIKVLETEHEELEDLFHEISGAKDVATMRLIAGDISDKLALLDAMESHILRKAATAGVSGAAGSIALWRHTADGVAPRRRTEQVASLMTSFRSARTADRTEFEGKVATLQEEVECDFEEFSREVQPKLASLFGKDRLWTLGAELVAMRRAFASRALMYPSAVALAA